MSPRARTVARTATAAAALAGPVWLLGPGPFVAGVRSLGPGTLVAALLLTVVATVACAWRWSLVAGGLGVAIGLREATMACYRAQLLNLVLPGGVVGDLRRGLCHGRDTGETGRALRSVAWERVAGQVVQGVLLVVVLVVLPGPVGPATTALCVAAVVAGAGLVLLRGRRPLTNRLARTVADDVRRGIGAPTVWPGVVAASVVALTAHVAMFVVAARAAGVTAPSVRLVPLALLVLVAAALPTNLAGWGPREGMAVWGFAAAGLGAEAGAATATAYGVLVLAAHLPALTVLVRDRRPTPGVKIAVRPESVRGYAGG